MLTDAGPATAEGRSGASDAGTSAFDRRAWGEAGRARVLAEFTQARMGERVFGVFERLEGTSSSAGTGMGLAICRKIVEVLGGGIGIEGDRGTDVRIVLPAAVGARWPSHELTAGAPR